MHGLSIKLFLINGKADSIIRTTLSNWNGFAYKIPKAEVKDCDIDEFHRPGVYFLFGSDNTGITCYVGESDDTLKRLKQHLNDDNPWVTAVAFLGTELDATKILFLEDRCFAEIKKNGRCKVITQVTNNKLHINNDEKEVALQYMDNMKIILPVLGYNVLEPQPSSSTVKKQDTLYFEVNGIKATGAETSDGFTVFAGSKLSLNPASSIPANANAKRAILFKDGIVNGDTFISSYSFNSSSEAACVIAGYSISGPQSWKYSDGTTLKAANDKAAQQL